MNEGLFVARLVFGTMLAAHGSQKLFGWFGGPDMNATPARFESLGFRPGRPFVAAVGLGECAAGGLLVLGLFQSAAAAVIVAVLIVAIMSVHWNNGLLATTNGVELPLLYFGAAFSLAFIGPGEFSIDAVLGVSEWWTAQLTSIVLTMGCLGGLAGLGWVEAETSRARTPRVTARRHEITSPVGANTTEVVAHHTTPSSDGRAFTSLVQ